MTTSPQGPRAGVLTPADGIAATGRADVLAMAEAARRAPSIHNSQPWHFRSLPDGLAVHEDLGRTLPVIDPRGRDRTISCGTALLNARVALAALGRRPQVALLPDPADATLIGTVTAGPAFSPGEPEGSLAAAVPDRRTHRRVYRSNLVAEEDLFDLRQAVAEEGARLTVADAGSRRRLSHLLRRAVRAQARDAELVGEVDQWVRRRGDTAVDGIPSASLGTGPFPIDSLVHDARQAAVEATDLEEELARSTLLVIATRGDTRLDWVVAGMALERMLLTATVKGLVATFTEQALQDADVRPQVAELLGIWGHPQVLLRIGRPLVEAPPTPRRPLADVLD